MPTDSDAFRDSIEKLSLPKVDLVDMSQSVKLVRLRTILDFHAPLSNRTFTVRPAAPWYSNEIKIERGKEDSWKGVGGKVDFCGHLELVIILKLSMSINRTSESKTFWNC